ncbi:dGTP triphosphohydrolase [Shewanella mangrovisoli]|uniref:dGTP triphosphohydrolase n=1 Tax=Shewanella mangrovisoli TaxID=2864211 RepID=UPI0035B9A439
MNWDKLLHNGRRKDKSDSELTFGKKNWGLKEQISAREEIERDFDRILFLAPTRRLADKTQVFPLEQNDSVRTRLTHSYEVSNLARSVGTQLAYDYANLFSDEEGLKREGKLTRTLPSLLAAIGLAHDLGNPPFGHQGESAIQDWFATNAEMIFPKEDGKISHIYNDFIQFDGNSQTIRLLTQLQVLNDKFGINLTYATLSAMLKYPQSSAYVARKNEAIQSWTEENNNNSKDCPYSKATWKKHGYCYSEARIIEDVWAETGLAEGIRHPLTYIMEACDDIAYSVLDAEDIIKKGLASFHDLINHLKHYMACERDKSNIDTSVDKELQKTKLAVIERLVQKSVTKHDDFSKPSLDLTPAELNDVSMQMFRVFAMNELVASVTTSFAQNLDRLMSKDKPIKDLMSLCDASILCDALKDFDKKWGYKNKSVLRLELEGHNYIHNLMDMLWIGIHGRLNKSDPKKSKTPFGEYAYGRISENYRRVFKDESNSLPNAYKEAQLLTDAISGMTDSYLIDLHNELKALYKNP